MNNKLTILLIEDDMIEVMKFNRTISKLGHPHKIIEAKNGEEALDFLLLHFYLTNLENYLLNI